MTNWVKIKIKKAGKEYRNLYEPTAENNLPYIGLAHIEQGTLKLNGIGNSNETSSTKKRFKKNDILFGTLRPYFRKVVKVGFDGLCSTDITVIRANHGYDQNYLFYIVASQPIIDFATVSSNGTKMPRAKWAVIGNESIAFPSLHSQKKIAAVLSAYDDLIENNNRRIAILEKMAEELYREWFVRLRFPGYQKIKIIKGVPAGWKVKKISDIVDFLSGYSFKSKTYVSEGKYGIVTIKNVQDGYFLPHCTDYMEDAPSNMKGHCILIQGDILMSLTGNVGRVCHVCGDNLLLNQRVAKLKPKISNASQFIFYTFKNRSMLQLIENLSLGSTAQMNLSPIQLGKQKMLVPNEYMLSRYEEMTMPLFKEKMYCFQSNALLQIARDRLLPRLMGGKIDVENMDIEFPPSMKEESASA